MPTWKQSNIEIIQYQLSLHGLISRENPSNSHDNVYFKTAPFLLSYYRTHIQSIKLSNASPLLTVGRAENLIITITMPASLVYFDKPQTSECIPWTTWTPSLLQQIRYCNIRIGSLCNFNRTKPCTARSAKKHKVRLEGGNIVKGLNAKPKASFQHI